VVAGVLFVLMLVGMVVVFRRLGGGTETAVESMHSVGLVR
jgi:hypothetical protein